MFSVLDYKLLEDRDILILSPVTVLWFLQTVKEPLLLVKLQLLQEMECCCRKKKTGPER